jgi:hypothetical protein
MKAVLLPISLVVLLLGTSFGAAVAGETRVAELLREPSRFDGRTLVVRGTLTRLQTHTSEGRSLLHLSPLG